MRLKEFRRDLFTLPVDFVIAQAVSADFVMGGGLALQTVHKYPDLRPFLFELVNSGYAKPEAFGDNVFPFKAKDGRVLYQLVTKNVVWENSKDNKLPNLDSLSSALTSLASYMNHRGQKKLGLPMIGCGLDKMNWTEVKALIEEVFKDTDFDIAICIQ